MIMKSLKKSRNSEKIDFKKKIFKNFKIRTQYDE